MDKKEYVFDRTENEMQRLILQHQLLGDLTEQVLRSSGIERGMKVLDLGVGAGDVAMLAADIVGPEGEVVGIDISSDSIGYARRRVESAGIRNIRFVQSEIGAVTLKESFDALIGRLILMYLPEPASSLRRTLQFIRPGGIVAFQEIDFTNPPLAYPPVPMFSDFMSAVIEAIKGTGAELQMGFKLHTTFLDAGLAPPQLLLQSKMVTGDNPILSPLYERMLFSALPAMQKSGVGKEFYAQPEGFGDRLRNAVLEARAIIVYSFLVGAWSRTTH